MEFTTIKQPVQAEIVEKKSKFIANLFRVESVQEAEERIKEIKKKYFDAKHNCMAYRIHKDNRIFEKSSDDGEPSGTAGAPMLNIFQKNNLSNILIIVTRYFGGILLGTGGLVRAYSDCLLKAIEESHLVNLCFGTEMLITTNYSDFERFKYYCRNHDILITNVEYCEWIHCKIELEDAKKEKLLKDFETKNIILKDLKVLTKKYISKSI